MNSTLLWKQINSKQQIIYIYNEGNTIFFYTYTLVHLSTILTKKLFSSSSSYTTDNESNYVNHYY